MPFPRPNIQKKVFKKLFRPGFNEIPWNTNLPHDCRAEDVAASQAVDQAI